MVVPEEPDQVSQPHTTPTMSPCHLPYLAHVDENRNVFSRLMPFSASQVKNNLNNSAQSSVDLNEELMRNLNLGDLERASDFFFHYNDGYIPYHLSRADDYKDGDFDDEIERVAAENRSDMQSLTIDELSEDDGKTNPSKSMPLSRGGKLGNLLRHTKHSKPDTKVIEDDLRLEDEEFNTNNNANGSDTSSMRRMEYPNEYDIDLSHLRCELQSSRSGRLPVTQCSHRSRQFPCPRCGYAKPDLKVRDVRFTHWMPPIRKLVLQSPETKKSGVVHRYRGLMGGKKTMDPNPSPASTSSSTPASTPRRKKRFDEADVIKTIRNSNVRTPTLPEIVRGTRSRNSNVRTPTLPEIVRGTRSFYLQTPCNADANRRKGSCQGLALPKIDSSPKPSLVSIRTEDNATPMSNRDASLQTPISRAGRPGKNKVKDAKQKPQQVSPQAQPPSRQGVRVQNQATVRIQCIPPHYRNSFHGSFVPHSLLKARAPPITSRQRMELIRSRKFKAPSHGRIMVEMNLTNPSLRVNVYRQSVGALKKWPDV